MEAELRIRPMVAADVREAGNVAAASFEMDITNELAATRFYERLEHLLHTDADGAFVAERDGRILGVAQAMVRERLWCLSLLAVAPVDQSNGAGHALLERVLGYQAGADAGLIVSSNDSRALRLYAGAGFTLLPTFEASGPLDRKRLPKPDRAVRAGDHADLEALAEISREVRGAPHTDELHLALNQEGQLLRMGDRGFALAHPTHGVWLLVARDDEAATSLLWNALAIAGDSERSLLRWVTGAQDWAIAVAVKAGLRLGATGALCVRGEPGPLRPFVPSGPFA